MNNIIIKTQGVFKIHMLIQTRLIMIKSVLGRVRNNIHEVLPYVARELRHYQLYVKWVLYKLHVSVARAGDGRWPPARVGHVSNDIHKTTACTTPCTSHLETHPRDVSHAQCSRILCVHCVCCCVLSLIHSCYNPYTYLLYYSDFFYFVVLDPSCTVSPLPAVPQE